MRKLSNDEIERFASKAGVKRIAVENFLMSMGENENDTRASFINDAASYGWNTATREAIIAGINLACRKESDR
jgi:hypothetical protein